ncbi:MAG: hypothetical protein K9N23_21040 [Akkermansiaceae bacterium]|nr:hypothetical protein [Akkermansiaceae bacterium]MCF7734183.1 hypothetical protein [Akkermansiaceae bacterium]
MQDPDLIGIFVMPFERAGIPYLVSGSVATAIFGEPRNTLGVDLAVFPAPGQLPLVPSLFPESDFYLPPIEVMEIECRRPVRGHFNIIHHASGFKADIYPSKNHPHLPWALEHLKRVATPAGEISLAPPEYVILHKLEFFREGGQDKHLRDIAGVINQQDLDLGFLTQAVSRLHLTEEWQAALHLAMG